MIGAFLTFLTNSRLARWIGAVVMGIVAFLTFGKIKRREGVVAERAREAVKDAKAKSDTIEKVLHETTSGDDASDIRKRMRDRARR